MVRKKSNIPDACSRHHDGKPDLGRSDPHAGRRATLPIAGRDRGTITHCREPAFTARLSVIAMPDMAPLACAIQ